ncbi:NUDIX domain-containing protein [Nocardioides sp. Kera G14]|uniref:NUDIX domain-containing protein n=1 Tax=Nocardioides sp. Kera G14 TaxID=2884264 RepID=UPI001D10441A|nr:NUDIX hydrolase [Nocardioides sp. Kera G14]UDY24758.1 NUDIX hydrolase [Nocardioides sp. Kera G14]
MTDRPDPRDDEGVRSYLNSVLPRKRAIGQMLIRAEGDEPRVLLCQLTYKRDWDLPGGVVEVNESPALAVMREVEEELALTIPTSELLLTDWLPPWSGWDDAVCLVFDGGVHEAALVDRVVRQAREIKSVAFCTLDEIDERAKDFTARRIRAALARVDGEGAVYTESGRPL